MGQSVSNETGDLQFHRSAVRHREWSLSMDRLDRPEIICRSCPHSSGRNFMNVRASVVINNNTLPTASYDFRHLAKKTFAGDYA
ncbi:hypothetical protein AVEN_21310-1 [Araneus ventricosus]|uniref:Uncharacterized protein n=1 Tax=Araneus ventricosus TaxID=182803 RepID=A0A4Y2J5E0_ARAVE|nr:hypothetical protein AVEN_21310-1 [Araneus ventricosus]